MNKSVSAYQKVNEFMKNNPQASKAEAFKATKTNPSSYHYGKKQASKTVTKISPVLKRNYKFKAVKVQSHSTDLARDVIEANLKDSTKIFLLRRIFA